MEGGHKHYLFDGERNWQWGNLLLILLYPSCYSQVSTWELADWTKRERRRLRWIPTGRIQPRVACCLRVPTTTLRSAFSIRKKSKYFSNTVQGCACILFLLTSCTSWKKYQYITKSGWWLCVVNREQSSAFCPRGPMGAMGDTNKPL